MNYSNCVGKGNRRIYWLFLFAGMLFCLFYFLTAKYVQHYVTCADDVTLQAYVSNAFVLYVFFVTI